MPNLALLVPTVKDKKPEKDEKPVKKTRKKKDADAPKKPMSAFFWYQQTRRSQLKEKHPNEGHKDLIKVSSSSTLWSSFIIKGPGRS